MDPYGAQLEGGLKDFYLLAKANDPELGRSQARVVGALRTPMWCVPDTITASMRASG